MLLNKKHRRIVLVGKAASGKDHFRKKIESRGFKYAVSYTTRPQREGEVHGKDYYFISEDEAKVLIESGFFYEYVIFNDLFIMTPKGIHEIKPEDRLESFVIYLDIPSNVRIKRLNKRHMPGDSVKRRIEADELDFSDFTDYDLRITNSDF
jgi:guanylate kinase